MRTLRMQRTFQCAPALMCALLLLLCASLSRPAAAQGPTLVYDPVKRAYYDPATGAYYGPDLLRNYAPNPGGAVVTTNSYTLTTNYNDTPVSVTDHTFATTIEATLGNQVVFQQTFALPYADPIVQAAVLQANVILTMNGAIPSTPLLASSSLTSLGSQTTTTETGRNATVTLTTTDTFGGALLGPGVSVPVPGNVYFPPDPFYFYVLPGQLDINVNSDIFITVDRTVTTTTTDLLSQRYNITGAFSGAAVPEPSAWALLSIGAVGVLALTRQRRYKPSRHDQRDKRQPSPSQPLQRNGQASTMESLSVSL